MNKSLHLLPVEQTAKSINHHIKSERCRICIKCTHHLPFRVVALMFWVLVVVVEDTRLASLLVVFTTAVVIRLGVWAGLLVTC